MSTSKRDGTTAIERYIALTGNRPALQDDPATRRFFDGYDGAAKRERTASKAKGSLRLLSRSSG